MINSESSSSKSSDLLSSVVKGGGFFALEISILDFDSVETTGGVGSSNLISTAEEFPAKAAFN